MHNKRDNKSFFFLFFTKRNYLNMSLEQFNLYWNSYSDHLKEMMENLLNSKKLADVTLVCNDKTKFKAHKFVLSAFSPVFQSIIDDLPYKEDSFIYLRGVEPQEMRSILQFMYLGQATFYQDRMNEFLNVAKSLEIKEISKDVECNVDTFIDKENDEYNQEDKEIGLKDKSSINETYVLKEIDQTETKVTDYVDEAGQYQCGRCEKKFTFSSGLYKHNKSAHEGLKFSCNKCNKTFTQNVQLKRHIKGVHEGVTFSCDLCDHTFTQKTNLTNHKKNKH